MKKSNYVVGFGLTAVLFHTSLKGSMMMSTLYAIYLEASLASIGIIVSLLSFFPMFLAVYAGKVSDRIGFRLPLIFGTASASFALALPVFFQNMLFVLFMTQLILGLGQIFFHVSIQNLVGALSSKHNRSNYYALFSLIIACANFMGPLITGFTIEYYGYSIAYFVLASITLIPCLGLIFRMIPIPKGLKYEKESHQQTRVYDLLKLKPLRKVLITSGIILTGIELYNFYFPIYGKHIGFSESIIGIILSVLALAFFIVRLIMPILARRYEDKQILVVSLILSAISFMALPFYENMVILAVISFILGLGLGCGQPLSIAMAYNSSPKGRTGEVLGVRMTVNKVSQFLIPVIFGSLGTVTGFIPIFWSNAFLFFMGGYINLGMTERKKIEKNLGGN